MRIRRYARSVVATLVAALGGLCVAGPARAQTSGRISLMNSADVLSNPGATIDAALFRLWLMSEHGNNALVVDMRSDYAVLASTDQKYGGGISTPFNGACHGDTYDVNRKKCQDLPVRDQTLGQLSELAGFYDLFYRIGAPGEHRTTFSVGRKTIYEAGLSTVDGITVERGINDVTNVGGFIGLAPDPLTRMFDPYYQTAGGFFSMTKRRAVVRAGLTALNYQGTDANKEIFGATKGALARATVFNQNFVQLGTGTSLGTFVNFDVMPGPVDRLVTVDFTFRPTTRYGVRLNVTRFRPIEFDQTPELINGLVIDPSVITAYLGVTGSAGKGSFIRSPEVLTEKDRIKAINTAKLAVHYVTAASFTPYVSAEYRQREADGKTELLADVGTYAYDPFNSGFVGRARVEVQNGYDVNGLRIGANLDRNLSEEFFFGGGFDIGTWTYKFRDPAFSQHYTNGANTLSVNGNVRYEKNRGLSFFLEAYYYLESRKKGAGEPTGGTISPPPPTSYSTISALVGFTYRFGDRMAASD